MKLSVWRKYHLFQLFGPIITVVISAILAFNHLKLLAMLVWFLGLICTAVVLHSIKCPKCGKSIDNYTTLLSGPEDGWLTPMSKTCKNCGYDFTSHEKLDIDNLHQ